MDDAVTFPVQPEVLRQKIDDVYAAFAHRRLSFPFTYCDCCIKASQAKRFETVPLRELTSEDLWAATSNIPHTAGSISDVWYLVPRVLEHATFERCTLDLSMVFSCLQKDDGESPSAREAAALRALFETIWLAERNAGVPLGHQLSHDQLVFVTAVLTSDILRYLDLWKGSSALEKLGAAQNNPFWDLDGALYRDLCDWMRRNMNEDILAGIDREKATGARVADILEELLRRKRDG
jgi:hypothetical protein